MPNCCSLFSIDACACGNWSFAPPVGGSITNFIAGNSIEYFTGYTSPIFSPPPPGSDFPGAGDGPIFPGTGGVVLLTETVLASGIYWQGASVDFGGDSIGIDTYAAGQATLAPPSFGPQDEYQPIGGPVTFTMASLAQPDYYLPSGVMQVGCLNVIYNTADVGILAGALLGPGTNPAYTYCYMPGSSSVAAVFLPENSTVGLTVYAPGVLAWVGDATLGPSSAGAIGPYNFAGSINYGGALGPGPLVIENPASNAVVTGAPVSQILWGDPGDLAHSGNVTVGTSGIFLAFTGVASDTTSGSYIGTGIPGSFTHFNGVASWSMPASATLGGLPVGGQTVLIREAAQILPGGLTLRQGAILLPGCLHTQEPPPASRQFAARNIGQHYSYFASGQILTPNGATWRVPPGYQALFDVGIAGDRIYETFALLWMGSDTYNVQSVVPGAGITFNAATSPDHLPAVEIAADGVTVISGPDTFAGIDTLYFPPGVATTGTGGSVSIPFSSSPTLTVLSGSSTFFAVSSVIVPSGADTVGDPGTVSFPTGALFLEPGQNIFLTGTDTITVNAFAGVDSDTLGGLGEVQFSYGLSPGSSSFAGRGALSYYPNGPLWLQSGFDNLGAPANFTAATLIVSCVPQGSQPNPPFLGSPVVGASFGGWQVGVSQNVPYAFSAFYNGGPPGGGQGASFYVCGPTSLIVSGSDTVSAAALAVNNAGPVARICDETFSFNALLGQINGIITYNPSDSTAWTPGAPSDVQSALDRVANWIKINFPLLTPP